MNEKLEKAFKNGSTLSYAWLKQNNLLDELPSPRDEGWLIPENKWEGSMFYYCDLKMWIYRPEES